MSKEYIPELADVCERCENWLNNPAKCEGCDHEEEARLLIAGASDA